MQQSEAAEIQRCADALERIADAQERQSRAAEIHAGAVAELARNEMPGKYNPEAALEEWLYWIRLYHGGGR